MSALIQIVNLLISIFGSLYLSVIILRFLLQSSRADFYNPISQAIVKLTNPILIPLRRVVPGLWGLDLATVLFALIFHALVMQLLILVNGNSLVNPLYLLIWSIVGIILNVIAIYLIFGFVTMIASFVAPFSQNPALLLVRQVMTPLLSPIQRFVPPVGGLDFSLFFAMIFLMIIRILVTSIGTSFHTPFQFLIGYTLV